jgi:hypothetical protein
MRIRGGIFSAKLVIIGGIKLIMTLLLMLF